MKPKDWPTIDEVAEEIRLHNFKIDDLDGLDIRLQIYPSGLWWIRYGDASYDTDHNGYWGAAILHADDDLNLIAEELLVEAKEQYAQEEV